MIVGVPTEIKDQESRVSLTPEGAEALIHDGHRVLVQAGAGRGSGFSDEEYAQSSAEILDSAEDIYDSAEMILKVKEPLPSEYPLLRRDLLLFTYLHLAADESLTERLLEAKATAIGYETVQRADGTLPLLVPMSEIAGKMAVQIGAHYLEGPQGGRGILLGGVAGVLSGSVVILGGGTVGSSAAEVALGLGARVTVIDIDLDRLRYLDRVMHGHLNTIASHRRNIFEAVRRAELLIGAVLIPGAKAPILVSEDLIAEMAAGSVVIDVAVDQGGCVETSRPTSHSEPAYTVHDVIHYAVPNMPGAVPRTSTYALSNATLPYVMKLANLGVAEALAQDSTLQKGVNTMGGHVTHEGVAEAFDLEYVSPKELI